MTAPDTREPSGDWFTGMQTRVPVNGRVGVFGVVGPSPKSLWDELEARVSGTGRTRLRSHLGDDQDLQQGGNAPDVSSDDQERFR
jgi:hypothetical protein